MSPKFSYTDKQHFQFGYQDPVTLQTRWLGRRANANEAFVAQFGRASEACTNWRAANQLAARKILDSALSNGLIPTICYSGGIDSEVALLSLLEAHDKHPNKSEIKIEIATLRLTPAINSHDLVFVEKFRAVHRDWLQSMPQVGFIETELNPLQFWESQEFLRLADETQIVSPQLLCHLWFCDWLYQRNPKALPIIAQGEVYLAKELPDDYVPNESPYEPSLWSLVETENLCGLYRFFIARGRPAVPGFFQYCPEQFETQLRTNRVLHELISNQRIGKLSTRTSKAEIVAMDYPELERRPKFHGFEPVQSEHDRVRALLATRLSDCEQQWSISVFDLYERLQVRSPHPIELADWSAGWGKDGSAFDRRGDEDDIFFTQWRAPGLRIRDCDYAAASVHLLSALKALVGTEPLTYVDDGSLLARMINCMITCISPKLNLQQSMAVAPSDISVPSPQELVTRTLATGIYEPAAHAHYSFAVQASSENAMVALPLAAERILDGSFNRNPMSTPGVRRPLLTENERTGVLARALSDCGSPARLVLPWTSLALTQALIDLTAASGWLDSKEASESNSTALWQVICRWLAEAGETDELRARAEIRRSEWATLVEGFSQQLRKAAVPSGRFQQATRDLVSSYGAATVPIDLGMWRACLDQAPLKVVSTEEWLRQAKRGAPGLRLGANLFAQQRMSGPSLVQSENRLSVALCEGVDAIGWLHLQLVAPDVVRIRGVTTRPDRVRQGVATKLLKLTVERIRSQPIGVKRIEVYSAPEVVGAFGAAGLVADPTRPSRSEELYNPETSRLESTNRVLTPLCLDLDRPATG